MHQHGRALLDSFDIEVGAKYCSILVLAPKLLADEEWRTRRTLLKTLLVWMRDLSKLCRNIKKALAFDLIPVLTELSAKFDKKEIVYVKKNPLFGRYVRRKLHEQGIQYRELAWWSCLCKQTHFSVLLYVM